MSQTNNVDELPEPPADAWAWELFEAALLQLACARADYEDLSADNQPLAIRAEARFELERIRDDIAILRNLVLSRPREGRTP